MTTPTDRNSAKANSRFHLVIALAIAAGLATGAVTAREAHAALETPATITIENFTFGPADLTVKAGTAVRWTNHDDIPHSIVATDKSFRSAALDTNDSYSFTFKTAGTFMYFCGLHPHMTGKVTVTP